MNTKPTTPRCKIHDVRKYEYIGNIFAPGPIKTSFGCDICDSEKAIAKNQRLLADSPDAVKDYYRQMWIAYYEAKIRKARETDGGPVFLESIGFIRDWKATHPQPAAQQTP